MQNGSYDYLALKGKDTNPSALLEYVGRDLQAMGSFTFLPYPGQMALVPASYEDDAFPLARRVDFCFPEL